MESLNIFSSLSLSKDMKANLFDQFVSMLKKNSEETLGKFQLQLSLK